MVPLIKTIIKVTLSSLNKSRPIRIEKSANVAYNVEQS